MPSKVDALSQNTLSDNSFSANACNAIIVHTIVCTHWAEHLITQRMELHKFLKFRSFVVLLDPLKILQNLFIQMTDKIFYDQSLHTFPMGQGSHKIHCLLCSFSTLVMEPNHTCMLLTPLLSPLITWLAKVSFLLRKNPPFYLAAFAGLNSTCTYTSTTKFGILN